MIEAFGRRKQSLNIYIVHMILIGIFKAISTMREIVQLML